MNDPAMFFRLRVEHTYFKNKNNLRIGFLPVGLSALLISKYILYFLERRDGFELYIDMKRLDMLSEILLEENTDHLEFIMMLKNGDFLNYTELDIPKSSFLVLKTPDIVNPVNPDGEAIALHQADFVSAADLTDFSSAAARNIPKEFFLKPNSFALIQLPFSKEENNETPVVVNGKINSFTGSIKFQARLTFWKYLFFPMEDSQFESIQVVDSKGQIRFPEMHEEEYSEGRLAYVTESDIRIPLQEISDYEFQLKGIQNGIEQTIIQRLAEPNSDYLSRENGKLYSTVFIYY
jgi:hypothetical protein